MSMGSTLPQHQKLLEKIRMISALGVAGKSSQLKLSPVRRNLNAIRPWRRLRQASAGILTLVIVLGALSSSANAHEPVEIQIESYTVTFATDPLDPVARQPSALLITVRNSTTGDTVPIEHVILTIITPQGKVEGPIHVFAVLSQRTDRIDYTFPEEGRYGILATLFPSGGGEPLNVAFTVGDVQPVEPPSIQTLFSAIQTAIPRVLVKWLHVASAMIWVGGIAFSLILFYPRLLSLDSETRESLLKGYLKYATLITGAAIIVLAATGVIRIDFHGITITTLDKLTSLPYGLAILIKMVLYSVMAVSGTIANVLWAPRLLKTTDSARFKRILRRVIAFNTLDMVLGITAALLGSSILILHSVF